MEKALADQTPVEIDRQLAPLWEKRQTNAFRITETEKAAKKAW